MTASTTHDRRIVDNITYVKATDLTPGPWRTSYLLKPDLEVLARSMTDYGWLQPILVQRGTNRIIDGNVRWEIAGASKKAQKVVGTDVPVIYHDCSDLEAAFMHIRLNRSKGVSLPRKVSRIVQDLLLSRRFDEQTLRKKLAMTDDELVVLVDGTLLKHRDIANHKYSKAWVPVEAPTAESVAHVIERPPNADR